MIDNTRGRKACCAQCISKECLISTLHNLADGLSKVEDTIYLEKMIQTGLDNLPVELWIIRRDQEVVK